MTTVSRISRLRHSMLARACTLPSQNLTKRDTARGEGLSVFGTAIKRTVTNALALMLTGKYEMNNKPRRFRVKITRTYSSPSRDRGKRCQKSLRSVPWSASRRN